jgi:hypothetical protein
MIDDKQKKMIEEYDKDSIIIVDSINGIKL